MKSDFNFDGIEGVRLETQFTSIHIILRRRISVLLCLFIRELITDSEGIANCLGLNAESKVELQDLIRILEPKLIEANRLKIGISG